MAAKHSVHIFPNQDPRGSSVWKRHFVLDWPLHGGRWHRHQRIDPRTGACKQCRGIPADGRADFEALGDSVFVEAKTLSEL